MIKYMCQLSKKTIILMLSLLLFSCKPSYKSGDILATLENDNANFSLKITAFEEKRDFAQIAAGAYYIFEVKAKDERDWREIMVIQYDDPIPINKNSIGFVNDKIGFVFMIREFAVTTDGGVTWSAWNISQSPIIKNDRSCKIQNVKVEESGQGIMNLECNNIKKILSTKDYGVTWNSADR